MNFCPEDSEKCMQRRGSDEQIFVFQTIRRHKLIVEVAVVAVFGMVG